MSVRVIVGAVVALVLAAGCRSAEPTEAGSDPLTSADFAEAETAGTAFALEFVYDSLPSGAARELRISPDGHCEGLYGGLTQHEMESGRRSGTLSAQERTAILVALRDAPYDALARIPKERVIDGEPVLIVVTIGERRLKIARQLEDLRTAGLEPLCRLLMVVLAHLPWTP